MALALYRLGAERGGMHDEKRGREQGPVGHHRNRCGDETLFSHLTRKGREDR